MTIETAHLRLIPFSPQYLLALIDGESCLRKASACRWWKDFAGSTFRVMFHRAGLLNCDNDASRSVGSWLCGRPSGE